jgi:hypothetical protein
MGHAMHKHPIAGQCYAAGFFTTVKTVYTQAWHSQQ